MGNSKHVRIFKLPRNVMLLGWTSFFTDVGSEMILPVLPLFLKEALRAPMTAIGLIEGAAEAVANAIRLMSGYFSDRMGKSKPFVICGYGLSTAVKPLLALVPTWHLVLGIRLLDRTGKGLRSAPRDSLVTASTPKEQYGKAFGFHRSMDTAGALFGSALASAALFRAGSASASGIRWLFAASAIPCVLALLFILPVVEPQRAAQRPKGEAGGRQNLVWRSPTLLLLIGVILWELGNISYAFVLLRLTDAGVPERFVGFVYVAYNVVYLLVAMPMGTMSDRIGIRASLLLGPPLGTSAFLALGAANVWTVVAAAVVLYAAHTAAINTLTRAAVAHFAPASGRGTMFGLVGACALLGNGLAGLCWERLGAVTAMRLAASIQILAVLPFSLLARRTASAE